MARPMLYHRAPAFTECLREVQESLRWLMQTKQQPLSHGLRDHRHGRRGLATSSAPATRSIVIRGGKFGERWGSICEAYGIELRLHRRRVGQGRRPQGGRRGPRREPRRSRRLRHRLRDLDRHQARHRGDRQGGARQHEDIILCVDAITAIGVFDVPVDKWGLDVVAVGSQKALMLPPGLAAIVGLGEGVEGATSAPTCRASTWTSRANERAQDKGETAFTPAVSLIVGLREALRMLKEETLDGVSTGTSGWPRRRAPRPVAWGSICSRRHRRTPSPPSASRAGVDGTAIIMQMRTRYGITIAGGQDHLKGKIVRIAHVGYYSQFDIITAISGLEMTLSDLGFSFGRERASPAAQATFAETRRA